MSNNVYCQFKHIPSEQAARQLVANIETFVAPNKFDRDGIVDWVRRGKNCVKFVLTREETDRLRDRFGQVLPNESSPIWLHIEGDPLHGLDQRPLHNTANYRHEESTFSLSCQFGSLVSHSLFYSHVSFQNKVLKWSFQPSRSLPNTLVIDFEVDDIRILIPFHAIQKNNILINKQNNTKGVFLLIPLKYTPYIYQLEPVKSDRKDKQNPDMKQQRLCANPRNNRLLENIELCSDFVIHFPQSQNMAWAFIQNFLVDRPHRYEINFSNFQILDWPQQPNKNPTPDPFDYKNASYEDRYALQMLISMGYVFRDKWAKLTDNELKWNTCDPKHRYSLCRFTVEQLCADHGYDLRRALEDYNNTRRKPEKNESEFDEQTILARNKQFIKVAVCTLTPMRTIFQPLEVTVGSRALRHPKLGGPERFLLVHFREEDNSRLSVTNRNIKERLRRSMNDGILLMGNNFRYIGASTGQMKEKAFWFIDLPPKIGSIDAAYAQLGKFDNIKNIATYIARVGQYFSRTSPVGITLTEVPNLDAINGKKGIDCVTEIPDIIRGEYNFTDGIGKIAWGLAGRVAQKMNIPLSNKEDIPSAFQIRVAGCKGMVAIDPGSSLNDYYILVRDSMMKFKSDDWNLEICDYARPISLTLNNQVIRLLSDLGNSDDAFRALQNENVSHWEVPEEQQSNGIEVALQKKISYLSKENLLTNRIPIPPTEGRNMFGVADETGELQYGQCFIQYSDFDLAKNGQRQYHVVTGTIIVTKNPCLWPGDFRRLEAVRNSKLEACMRDVIVFPINGSRPHSNEISGSDLDGDQYWVYWGKRFQIKNNVPALSYQGAKKASVPFINREKMIEHIVESFAAGIMVGMIANTHTVVADKHKDHSFSDECKKLAELFALAVDSPKTGMFIKKEEIRPFQREYCNTWPEYMRKFGERSSHSTSILEALYQKAAEIYRKPNTKLPINMNPIRWMPTAANQITDAAFENWLKGQAYKESSERKLPKTKASKPAANAKSDSDESSLPTLEEKSLMDDHQTPMRKIRSKKTLKQTETPDTINSKVDEKAPKVQKKTSKTNTEESTANNNNGPTTTQEHQKLINSDYPKVAAALSKPSASASFASSKTSVSLSFAPLNSDQSSLDFQIISDPVITAASNVEFVQIDGTWCTVRPRNELEEEADRTKILDKLVSCMEKQNVLKRNSLAVSNQPFYGPLHLIVFYGHIYLTKHDSQKFNALQRLVNDNSEQILRFNYANADEFNMESSATSKTEIDYELDCCLDSSKNITLLFDKNKILRQIVVYQVWSRSYMCLPNYNADNLYEIRSILTHELNSQEFTQNRDAIFKGDTKGLLTGRKPYIKVDRNLLHSSVKLISLKIIDEVHFTRSIQSEIDSFYRKINYVSLNDEQERPNVSSTLEYHVTSINKSKDVLTQICRYGLSPLENPAASERSGGRSSKASGASGGLRGFSMSNE